MRYKRKGLRALRQPARLVEEGGLDRGRGRLSGRRGSLIKREREKAIPLYWEEGSSSQEALEPFV